MCRLSLDACSCLELFLLAACRFELSFARVLALFGIYRISCSLFGCRVSALVKSFARMSSSILLCLAQLFYAAAFICSCL